MTWHAWFEGIYGVTTGDTPEEAARNAVADGYCVFTPEEMEGEPETVTVHVQRVVRPGPLSRLTSRQEGNHVVNVREAWAAAQ